MGEAFIGDIIRRKREELGLTQADLADGICSVVTISRIESGKTTPKRPLLCAILGRLDLPEDRYPVWVFKEEQKFETLQRKLVVMDSKFEHALPEEKPKLQEEVQNLYRELEDNTEDADPFVRQQIARSRLIMGNKDGAYTPKEEREKLLEIIRMTCPKFDPEDIGAGRYSTDELKMLNHLGLTYSMEKNHLEAIMIYRQIYAYIKKNIREIPVKKSQLCSVILNYAKELNAIGSYQKANNLAEEGRRLCLDNAYYYPLAGLLDTLAESFHFLGNQEESVRFYKQAFHLTQIMENEAGQQAARFDAKKFAGIEL